MLPLVPRLPLPPLLPLLLLIACGDEGNITAPTTGTLVVLTMTTGDASAGYTVTLDNDLPQGIGPNATVSYTEVVPGPHAVALTGLPAGCAVSGENPRTVNIEAGSTSNETFAVACTPNPTTGSIRIVTISAGTPDLDGYAIAVDAAAPLPIQAAGEVTLPNIDPGPHTVTLSGLAPGCSISGDNPRPITVSAGATAEVSFAVTCVLPTVGRWTRMESGTAFSLLSVWGSSPTDVFVTGEPGGAFTSTIFHYDGQAWSEQFIQNGVTLNGVWGSSATDVFAVGPDPLGAFGYDGAILHYNGTTWSPMTTRGLGSGEVALYSVWGSSPTDVYVVGEDFAGLPNALVAHFNGSGWSRVLLPATFLRVLFDVHGTSAQDVWAVGFNDLGFDLRGSAARSSLRAGNAVRQILDAQGIILHYNGSGWTEFGTPELDLVFNGVWSAAPNDVFAVGQRGETAVAYHFDGTAWAPMTVPPVRLLMDVWGTSGTDVYAVGEGTILHYDGAAWTEVQTTEGRLTGVWGSSPADVFAVGARGTILHGTPAIPGSR